MIGLIFHHTTLIQLVPGIIFAMCTMVFLQKMKGTIFTKLKDGTISKKFSV